MLHHKPVCFITILLVVIGGLNWGLIGLGGFFSKDLNIVHALLRPWPAVEWVIYLLVGIASLCLLLSAIKYGKKCPCNKMNSR